MALSKPPRIALSISQVISRDLGVEKLTPFRRKYILQITMATWTVPLVPHFTYIYCLRSDAKTLDSNVCFLQVIAAE